MKTSVTVNEPYPVSLEVESEDEFQHIAIASGVGDVYEAGLEHAMTLIAKGISSGMKTGIGIVYLVALSSLIEKTVGNPMLLPILIPAAMHTATESLLRIVEESTDSQK